MAKTEHQKPAGEKLALRLSTDGVSELPIQFPVKKEDREWAIARMFARWSEQFERVIGRVTIVRKNPENDLDFTIQTAAGERQLELAEFAPLHKFGNSYANVPSDYRYTLGEMGQLICDEIDRKSRRQGGKDHWLLFYVTHGSLFITPPAIEMVRRKLDKRPPRFERVLALSPANAVSGTAIKIYPSDPHSMFASHTDEQLACVRITVPSLRPGAGIMRIAR